MEKTEFPCTCGHYFIEHEDNPDSAFFGLCMIVKHNLDNYSEICRCLKYKADNLRFLESLVGKHGRL